MTAMPFVKPTTTGRGMNLTAVPKPVAPKTSRMIPANRVHMNNPSMPYFATIPNTTTTKAPVGPPICVEDPPKAEITKPATIAQYRPACGGIPEAIAKAIAKGSATSPTVIPARRSAMNRRGVYDLKHSTDFGNQAPILFDRFGGTDQCQECRFLWRYITPTTPHWPVERSRGVCLGAGGTGRSRDAERLADRDRCDDTGSQCGDALDCAAGHGRELRGVSAGLAKASGVETPTREDLARLDRKRKKRMSNKEWKSPADADARIAKMKDGRTHLAHKPEHAVDPDTGAVVAVTLQGADKGDTTTLDETLGEAGMAVAELVGREAELQLDDKPKVNVNGIEELVTDKGYHSGAVVKRVKSYEVRSYIPEKQQKGRRNWQGKAEEQQAVYQNRRRVQGEYGKSLLRRRGELVERSFAHCYESGGMRRTHLRGHQNILKRQLIHVGAFNLSLILRKLMGAGTPREWSNRGGLLLLLAYFLPALREGRDRLCRGQISRSRARYLASPRKRLRRLPCRNLAPYTTGC